MDGKKTHTHTYIYPTSGVYAFRCIFGVPAGVWKEEKVVQYNGGLLPDIILLTQCYYHRGTRLNAMKGFCLCTLLPVVITEPLDTEVVNR